MTRDGGDVSARGQYGAAIVACIAGAGLVLLALRQGWARVVYDAPRPLPSGSIRVTGQALLPAAGALALAALACLAAIIATRGLARRVAGLAMAGLGVWIAADVLQPVRAASVLSAASGQVAGGALGGQLPGGNSAIGGGSPGGGGLPALGAASRVVLDSAPWRPVAVLGAAAVVAVGLFAAWRGPRWAVMSARFDRPAAQPDVAFAQASPGAPAEPAAAATAGGTSPAGRTRPAPGPVGALGRAEPSPADAQQRDSDAAALWEALDRGIDLTDTAASTGSSTAASTGSSTAASTSTGTATGTAPGNPDQSADPVVTPSRRDD